MCLALLAIGQHPRYPIIILSNRDEFYKRPSAAASFWDDDSNIYAGRDLVQNGTWLGVNRNGHFALVTNYRSPQETNHSKQSRGLLVKNYLFDSDHFSPEDYIQKISSHSNDYNKFNLLIGNQHEIYYYSNVENKTKKLSPGIYGISNHLLDSPWFKVERVKELFSKIKNDLMASRDLERVQNLLFPILADNTPAPHHLLPETGVGFELEKLLSSIFVDIPKYQYGTYSSSILLFEEDNISFSEKIFVNGSPEAVTTTMIHISNQPKTVGS